MKRKIAIVMVSVLTVLTLAACGDKSNKDTSAEAPVAAEPIESVAEESVAEESVVTESVVAEPIIVQDAEGARVYNDTATAADYNTNLSMSTAEKYHLEYGKYGIVLDGDTPTEVLEALLNEEELGSMYLYADTKYYVDSEDPEYRQEIADVLIKNEELKYSNN